MLICWFSVSGRAYPWRATDDPFKVLIAEIMLRRTRAGQVTKVYVRLFARYPDVASLAQANEAELQSILSPLGLRWRNGQLGLLARKIEDECGGKVPDTRGQLLRLPGVGQYVAGAVLSIGYGKREWMVDSNIARCLSRYFGIRPPGEVRRAKAITEIAEIYTSEGDSRTANLAILDFAALICRSRRPRCHECHIMSGCRSAHNTRDGRQSWIARGPLSVAGLS